MLNFIFKIIKTKFVIFFLFFAIPLVGFSTTYFVSPKGLYNNDGNIKSPFKSINQAANTAKAGDSIMIRGGIYKELISVKNSGTFGDPIVFCAYKKERVVIDGSEMQTPDTLIFEHYKPAIITLNKNKFIEIINITIKNADDMGIFGVYCENIFIKNVKTDRTKGSGIMFRYCQRIKLDGNTVKDACISKPEECISVAYTDTFEVCYNTVFCSDTLRRKVGGEGIDIKNGSMNGSVHHNLVYDITTVGIYIDSYRKPEKNIAVYCNKVYNNKNGIALSAEKGQTQENVRVYNNIVYSNLNHGITISSWVENGLRKDIYIYNNTVYNNGNPKWGGGITIEAKANIAGIYIYNNLCYKNIKWQISAKDSALCVIENNLSFPLSTQSWTGEVKGKNAVHSEIVFEEESAMNFKLVPFSLAIDKGKEVSLLFDFDGQTRPRGKAIDIGAYEF